MEWSGRTVGSWCWVLHSVCKGGRYPVARSGDMLPSFYVDNLSLAAYLGTEYEFKVDVDM